MKVKFYKKQNDNSASFVKELEVKGKTDDKNFMTLIDLNIREVAKEILGCPVQRSGFRSIRLCGDYWSSFRKRSGVARNIRSVNGMSEMMLAGKPEEPGDAHIDWSKVDPVAKTNYGVGGEDTGLFIGVDVFDTGYIINSSAKSTNVLGGKEPLWFTKITKKYFKQGARSSAKLFKDEKALLKYLKEHRIVFERMHAECGYTFGWEKASSLWEHEPKAEISLEIDKLFSEINTYEDTAPETPKTYGDTPKTEAVLRMREMDLYRPVVKDFEKSDKLYMSEFGGIIYDLNDEAKEAVRKTKDYGLPYHVIRSQHPEAGDLYAVLFVSNEERDWESERPNKDGILYANVYNASMGFDEIGTIGIESVNGGLVRVA